MDGRAPWYLAGPLVGLTLVGMLWATNRPLGALGGYIDTWEWLKRPVRSPSFRVLLFLGIIAGGFAQALLAGPQALSPRYGGFIGQLEAPLLRVALLLGAGLLMGYGARTAGGCTSGHGLSGTSLGSPASFVATMTFMGTAVAAAHALALVLR